MDKMRLSVISLFLIFILSFFWFSFAQSANEVSANVSLNPYNQIVQQLKEKEAFLEQEILRVEIFKEKIFIILLLGWSILFVLSILSFYFVYKWKKAFFLLAKFAGEKSSKETKDKKFINNFNSNFQKKAKTEANFSFPSFCRPGHCFFKGKNKEECELIELGDKIIGFAQKLSKNKKGEISTDHLAGLGLIFKNNCFFKKNCSEENFFYICKKNLRKIRYNLNKTRKNNQMNSFLKKEAETLWQKAHKISLAINKYKKNNIVSV